MADVFDSIAPQQNTQSAPQAQSGDIFDQVTPGSSSSSQQQPDQQGQQQGLLSRAGQVAGDLATGFGKGALDTVNGVSTLLNKFPLVGESLAPRAGIDAADQAATATNGAQKVGKVVENIAEFMLGDEALKGASLGEKMLKAGKLAEYYEKAGPTAKAVIEHMMTAARQGAVSGIGETVKSGGDVEAGARAAEVGAIASGVAGAVLPAAAKGIGKVARGVAEAVGGPWTEKAVQEPLQAGIRDVFSKVADEAEVSPAASNVRNTARSVAEAVQEKSKDLFAKIDDATEGEFTNIQQKLKNVDMKLRDIAGTDDAAEEKLVNQQTALRVKLDETIEVAKKAGVDPDVAEQARSSWKQMSALSDVDREIKLSTFGEGKNAAEVVDPRKLVGRLQKLDDSGRLEEALGRDQADDLLRQAYDSAKASTGKAARQKVAKEVGIGAAKAAGIGAGASVLGHVLSGNH